jgi:hypothetical protein
MKAQGLKISLKRVLCFHCITPINVNCVIQHQPTDKCTSMKRSIKNQSNFVLPVFVRQFPYVVSQFTEQKRIQIYKH